jgi:hypothetical protein
MDQDKRKKYLHGSSDQRKASIFIVRTELAVFVYEISIIVRVNRIDK